MKRVDELGISRFPWKAGEYGYDVVDVAGCRITEGCDQFLNREDALLVQAAPSLYRELWKVCYGGTGYANCGTCGKDKGGGCGDCQLAGARNALSSAGGEKREGGSKCR